MNLNNVTNKLLGIWIEREIEHWICETIGDWNMIYSKNKHVKKMRCVSGKQIEFKKSDIFIPENTWI